MTYEKWREEYGRVETEDGKLSEIQQHRLYQRIKNNLSNQVKSPKGYCMFCEQKQEQVIPFMVMFCPDCAKKFFERKTVEEVIPMRKKISYFKRCQGCGKEFNCFIEMDIRSCLNCYQKFARRARELKLEEEEREKHLRLKQIVVGNQV